MLSCGGGDQAELQPLRSCHLIKNIINITLTKYEEQLTVLMGVGQAVGDQRGDRAVAPRTDEAHRARVLEEAGAGDKARHPRSILKYGQSSNFEYC